LRQTHYSKPLHIPAGRPFREARSAGAGITWAKQPATGRRRERRETSFYVCQIALSAADFAEAVSANWTIENRNHHVRDVTLGEDHSRIRVQPGPFTRIRSFALNIFRANGIRNVAQARDGTALNPDKLFDYASS
jgi:hypothetical protein